jgi:glycerol-1-phosphate dehydrogenase [NAD(P)+]
MNRPTHIGVPALVRIKPGALGRVGIYLGRMRVSRAVLLVSEGLPSAIVDAFHASLTLAGIRLLRTVSLVEASYEVATGLVPSLPAPCHAIVGLGGGRALDVAKYVAHLAKLPYLAIPTSLSNDGFASPTASLTVGGRRRSFGCALPRGVVVDTEVCHGAPKSLWFSGIGDVAAKVTAVADWKLAFHANGEPVDDLAALLSDATVFQLAARPVRDLEGERLLATALLLDGVAMEMAGSSRPASGSEHLISHALDSISERPRLHGLQVGMAAYLVGALQRESRPRLEQLLVRSDFFDEIRRDPFSRSEWLQAVAMAPTMKDDFHTVLSERPDALAEISNAIMCEPHLHGCFVA